MNIIMKIMLWLFVLGGWVATLNWYIRWIEIDPNKEMDFIRTGLLAFAILEIDKKLKN